jgi:hypothetical protein
MLLNAGCSPSVPAQGKSIRRLALPLERQLADAKHFEIVEGHYWFGYVPAMTHSQPVLLSFNTASYTFLPASSTTKEMF